MAGGIATIGWGQYAVAEGKSPFDWPFTAWMDRLFEHAFDSENTLSFGVPLFLLGALLFAIASPSVRRQSIARPNDKLALPTRRGWILLLSVAVAAWGWLNAGLFLGHYDPAYRWIFFSSLAVVVGALFVHDAVRGRLKLPHLKWKHAIELVVLAGIVGTFIGINVRDLAEWRYAAIGDEGPFYTVAQRILHDDHLNWFSQRGGPYDVHPVLGSVWHAVNLRVFGSGLFGWKMGALAAIAVTLPVFFWLLRETLGARVAAFGTLFLGASHYLFSYAHTGYNNVFALFPTVSALAFLVAGTKRSSPALLFLSGASAGLGFYTYHSSRAAIGIVGLVLLTTGRRRLGFDTLASVAAGFVMVVLPLFAADRWLVIDSMFERSVTESNEPFLAHVLDNLPRTFLAFNYNPSSLHYTAGALMDGFSATLAIAGFALAAARLRQPPYRLLVIWFFIAAIVAGVLSNNTLVSISRLHYVLPPLAAFAGLALDRLVASMSALIQRPRIEWLLTAITFALVASLIFTVNGRHFFLYSARHSPTTTETVIVRELADARCADQKLRSIAYMPEPHLLNFVQRFFDFGGGGPLLVAFRDHWWTYNAYPASGGVGCLAIGTPGDRRVSNLLERLESGAAAGLHDFRIATDLAGWSSVAFVPASSERRALSSADLAKSWRTDLHRGDGLEEIIQGQEKDALSSIDAPTFTDARRPVLHENEPVVVVTMGDQSRAYPVRILLWHGVVNDTLGGVPIVVTYDPIAAAARVFERRIASRELMFGTTGLLKNGNVLLYDRETETWWQQLTGRAVVGELAGLQLKPLPSVISPWWEFRPSVGQFNRFEHQVLVAPTDEKRYTRNPYLGYDVSDGKPIFTLAPADERLPPMRRVTLIDMGGRRIAVAHPAEGTTENQVYTIDLDGTPLVLFFDWRALSALDSREMSESRSVGSYGVYVAMHEARRLTFEPEVAQGEHFIDAQTGTRWNILGRGIEGPLAGAQLSPVLHVTGFWFSISAVYPDIELVREPASPR